VIADTTVFAFKVRVRYHCIQYRLKFVSSTWRNCYVYAATILADFPFWFTELTEFNDDYEERSTELEEETVSESEVLETVSGDGVFWSSLFIHLMKSVVSRTGSTFLANHNLPICWNKNFMFSGRDCSNPTIMPNSALAPIDSLICVWCLRDHHHTKGEVLELRHTELFS